MLCCPGTTRTDIVAPADRRPIAARDWQPIQAAAARLVRAQASPNAISVAGMAAACGGGLLFAATARGPAWPLFLAGALLVQLRLLANVLDGMVAVGRGVASPVGELYNEVPDRIADSAILAGLGIAALDPALGLLAALLAMLTAYVRTTGRAAGAPSDFRGPMAKQQRMALVTAAALVCAAAPSSWTGPVLTGTLWLVVGGSALTAIRRLLGIARALRP